ncbi:MAG: MFS transporter [Flavobacteriales bacterium]|jgi:putative MFS transporter
MALSQRTKLWLTILVASLGYFVDIYDLQLFNIISRESLRGLGITDPETIQKYDYLLFLWQMGGMLIGGLLWGILGDLKGRKNILFGSILLYSLANFSNAFVVTLEQYSLVRFIAGLGLAGELGAAITLVSEIMHKEKRGYGTMIIVTMGALGAVAAVKVSETALHWFGMQPWQVSYLIGGSLGLLLLLLRVGTFESGMFDKAKSNKVSRGNFFMLFRTRARAARYIACILVGLPVWFVVGVLIKFSDQFARLTGVTGEAISVGRAIMYVYIGLSAGDLLSGLLSQWFRSRRQVILLYLIVTALLIVWFTAVNGLSQSTYYLLCFALGAATGYWALFVSMAAEQFGTNIRATVATTVPNFVRGAVIPIILSYKSLEIYTGSIHAAWIVGGVCMLLAVGSTIYLRETFGKDLDYLEVS